MSSRHIIVIIDGTNCSAARGADEDFTNAFAVSAALANPVIEPFQAPVILYFPGPGNRNIPGKTFNAATGSETEDLVREVYLSLCINHNPATEDKIYIFGYSRGAVVAKALIELVTICGLISRENFHLIEHAYNFYLHRRPANWSFLQKDLSRRMVDFEFVGLFDPVAGYSNQWMKTNLSERMSHRVKHAVEIFAINESRRAFKPHEWRVENDVDNFYNQGVRRQLRKLSKQALQQIYIPGGHGDLADRSDNSIIADIAFLTMVERICSTTELRPNFEYLTKIYNRVVTGVGDICINERRWFRNIKREVPRRNTIEMHPLYAIINNKVIYKRKWTWWREMTIWKKLGITMRPQMKFFRPKSEANAQYVREYAFDIDSIIETQNATAQADALKQIEKMLSQIDVKYSRDNAVRWINNGA